MTGYMLPPTPVSDIVDAGIDEFGDLGQFVLPAINAVRSSVKEDINQLEGVADRLALLFP